MQYLQQGSDQEFVEMMHTVPPTKTNRTGFRKPRLAVNMKI